MCVSVCLCLSVCVREREQKRETILLQERCYYFFSLLDSWHIVTSDSSNLELHYIFDFVLSSNVYV